VAKIHGPVSKRRWAALARAAAGPARGPSPAVRTTRTSLHQGNKHLLIIKAILGSHCGFFRPLFNSLVVEPLPCLLLEAPEEQRPSPAPACPSPAPLGAEPPPQRCRLRTGSFSPSTSQQPCPHPGLLEGAGAPRGWEPPVGSGQGSRTGPAPSPRGVSGGGLGWERGKRR